MHTASGMFRYVRPSLLLAALSLTWQSRAFAQNKPDSTSVRSNPLGAMVISATRTEQSLTSLPSHVVVIGAPAIAASPAQTVPDLLRSVPGFSTRDYQSGLMIGPSSSMVSFRGLGGSSAGRTLVLLDGIPAGDPFSGWIDWGRIPLPLIQSAEVVRGGGSTIWGSRSLGGVVNLRTVNADRTGGRVLVEGGSLGTYHGSGAVTVRRGKLGAAVSGDYWDTDGFVITRKDQAGAVDLPSGMASRAVSAKVIYDASKSLQGWVSGGAFHGGDRPLGDEDSQNFTEMRSGARWLSPKGGIATVALFANRRASMGKSYTVVTDRSSQSPQRTTDAPGGSTGVSLQWTQMVRLRHELSVGADLSHGTGRLVEQSTYVNGAFTQERAVGGAQEIGGVFLQDAADLGKGFRLLASVRADRVRDRNARRTLRDIATSATLADTNFAERTSSRLTYSAGLRWQQSTWLAWRGSAYQAFRAPSMYELYQPRFSSRGTVTEANAALEAERLAGLELGADVTLAHSVVARVTGFRNRVTAPIMDITIGTAGATAANIPPCGLMPARQTCSQRRNVDGLLSRGLESEISWRPNNVWTLSSGYAYSPTRVIAPGQPADTMQAIRSARHLVNASIGFDAPRFASVAVEGRYVGSRFDDDINTIKLKEFYLIGIRVNRNLGRGLTAHLKVENLLNEEFEIARTRAGLADMGAPRWVTAGIRAAW